MHDTNLEEILHRKAQTIAESAKEAQAKRLRENPNVKAREIIDEYNMIFFGDSFFKYFKGRYIIMSDNQMKQIIHDHIKDDYRQSKFKEIQDCMIAQCLVDTVNIKNGVNVLNGVFDFDTKTLIPHSYEYRFTTQVQANYEPNAPYDKWLQFLQDSLGDDPSKIQILQEYIGYALDSNVNVEMILFLLGRGANGKSVFCDAIKYVLGSGNCGAISLDDLRNKNYIAELLGKLINISTESQGKAEVYESSLKRLASGEEITVDRKFKHPFVFKSNCKHIYSLNSLPRVSDKTDAFFRRVITIPFNFQIAPDKRILQLGRILSQDEASGILNWMLDGYYRLKSNQWRFTRSAQSEAIATEYRRDNNNVLNFIDECCEFGKDYVVTHQDSYKRYQEWCRESGVQPIKRNNFLNEIVSNCKDQHVHRGKYHQERSLYNIRLVVGNYQDLGELSDAPPF